MEGFPSGTFSPDSSFPRTRESRFVLRPISLDTRPRFREGMLSNRGYDGRARFRVVFGALMLSITDPQFSKEARSAHEGSMQENFTFVSFVPPW
jgi:hypothetical protein